MTRLNVADQPSREHRDGGTGLSRTILLPVLGMAVLVAIHLWLGRGATVPRRGPTDQWGYLGNARYLADSGPIWVLPSFPFFSYGYSATLVPAFMLLDDPERLFLAIRVTNALLLASVFPLLLAFCRRVLGLARWPALAGGFAGALVPGAIAHSSAALAENLVLPLVVIAVLSCWSLLTDRPVWQRLAFGPSIVALVVTHNRFVRVLLVMAVVLVIGAAGGLIPRWIALINAISAVCLLVGALALRGRIVAARWVDGVDSPEGPLSDVFDVVSSWSNLGRYLVEVVGQLWYVAAGTVGLGTIGIVALSRLAASTSGSELRRRMAVIGSDARRLTIVFVLASAVSVLLISTYFFFVNAGSQHYIVGRHNDSFVPIWTAAGVAFLLGERVRSRALSTTLASAGVVVALTVVLLLVLDRADWESFAGYSNFRAPALHFHASTHVGVLLISSAVALGLLLMIVTLVAARGLPGVLVPIACAWMVATVASTIDDDQYVDDWDVPAQFARLDVERVATVQGRDSGMPLYYQYFLPTLDPTPWDGRGVPPETFVFAPIPGIDMESLGARLILLDDGVSQGFRPPYAMGLWVMPGPELDGFRRTGQLLPTPDAAG